VSPLRILFVSADLAPFLTTRARRDAFLELGQSLECVTAEEFAGHESRWLARLSYWTLLTPRTFAFNRAILEAAERTRAQVVWIEKGTEVFPRTLRALRRDPSRVLVYHNTDDWKAKTRLHRLHWRYLLRGLHLYDLHFTSNLHNVKEFQELGLPEVHHMELAANPIYPEPVPVPEAERMALGAQVGFIGHWEEATERALRRVAEAGLAVKIYGPGWNRADLSGALGPAVQGRSVTGLEYMRAILSFDVNVGIVSKWNRNHTASRTFQIPALGAFLLHERNEVVRELFREGVEAEFFGSADELVEKCRYYVAHPDERRRIAEAGRRRCLASGYFETNRIRDVLPLLEQLVAARR
jgi:glycosyltransferase involved in cell wall biosynthesis